MKNKGLYFSLGFMVGVIVCGAMLLLCGCV